MEHAPRPGCSAALLPRWPRIAFTSQRTGTQQVYIGHVSGGFATQVTFHSEGTSVEEWFPDGQSLLVQGERDHSFMEPQRLFRVNVTKRAGEELLFDATANDGAISPDGRKILFTREGVAWWRKGYRGSEASQIWLYDIPTGEFTKLVDQDRGGRSPLWRPDGKAFYYVGAESGSFNLWQRDLATGKQRRLTNFSDDSVLMPCISRDGSTIVFRHLFDFYRYRPGSGKPPQRLDIYCDSDVEPEPVVRRMLESATEVSFSSDGLELAMIAGGNVWVMDTVLCEPRQVTFSAEEESSPAFAPDGKSILFVSDMEGETDIWRATRADSHKYWWQNDRFALQRLTHDSESKSDVQWSPTGDKVAFVKGRGDLWIMDPDGQNAHRLLAHWNHPTYEWSPDGKWLTYAVYDDDFNRDVWVLPVDGSRAPVNLSCHPNIDDNPAWSPDGRIIAFTGRRQGVEAEIYFVYLQRAEDEADDHDRAVQRAMEKLRKARSQPESCDPAREGNQAVPPGEVQRRRKAVEQRSAAAEAPAPGADRLRPHRRSHSSGVDSRFDRGAAVVVARFDEAGLHGGAGRQDGRLYHRPARRSGAGAPFDAGGQVGPLAVAGQPHRVALLRHTGLGHPRQGRGSLPFLGAAGSRCRPKVRRGFRPLLAHDARPLLRSAFE